MSFDKREELYNQWQEAKQKGSSSALRLKTELQKLDALLDCQEEPSFTPSSICPLKKIDLLFNKGRALTVKKRGWLLSLILGDPRADLARLIPKLCDQIAVVQDKKLRKILEDLKIESQKRWNPNLYKEGFLDYCDRWNAARAYINF